MINKLNKKANDYIQTEILCATHMAPSKGVLGGGKRTNLDFRVEKKKYMYCVDSLYHGLNKPATSVFRR